MTVGIGLIVALACLGITAFVVVTAFIVTAVFKLFGVGISVLFSPIATLVLLGAVFFLGFGFLDARFAESRRAAARAETRQIARPRPSIARIPVIAPAGDESRVEEKLVTEFSGLKEDSSPAVAESSPDSVSPETSSDTVWEETLRTSEGTSVRNPNLASPPAWVTAKEAAGSQLQFRFLHSQRFATVQEAREQLWKELSALLVQHMRPQFPEIKRSMIPTYSSDLYSDLVPRECVETSLIRVGEFQEKIHQVHWYVVLTDDSCKAIESHVVEHVAAKHLKRLTGLFGLSSIMLALGAWVFRKPRIPQASAT